MRKIVRPRLKIDSAARQARHVPKEREEEGQAADSTTESDEPGQYINILRGYSIFRFCNKRGNVVIGNSLMDTYTFLAAIIPSFTD